MKTAQECGQGKNVEHLISMKGHESGAAEIYFQKPGV